MGLAASLFNALQPGGQGGGQSIFANPNFQSLAALAGAMGQGAMPSPVKVPFGAILGQAVGAMGAGANNANTFQQGANQAQQGQLQNQLMRAEMPFQLSLLSGGMGGSSGAAGAPQSGGSTSAAGLPAGFQPPAGAGPDYLQSPQGMLAMARYAMATGQDRAASAIFSNLQAMAGGPGFALSPNGTAFAVPGGGKDPNVVQGLSAAGEGGSVSADNALKPINIGTADHPIWTTANQAGVVGNGTAGGAAPSGQVNLMPALSSVPGPVQNLALAGILGSGMTDPVEAATWISAVHNESDWNPNAPPGSKGEVGMGQVLPATAQMLKIDPSTLSTPQGNAIASAKVFDYYWKQANGDPAKALAGYNSGDVTQPDTAYVSPALARLQAWGIPGSFGSQSQAAPGVTVNHLPTGGVAVNDTSGVQDDELKSDGKDVGDLQDDANTASLAAANLGEVAAKAAAYPTGKFADVKADLSGWVTSAFGADAAKRLDLPDNATYQEIVKQLTLSAGQSEREAQGARGSYAALSLYLKNMPNPQTQPEAIQDLNNIVQLTQAYHEQYATGAVKFYNQARDAYATGQRNYAPQSHYDEQWNQQMDNGRVLGAGMMAATGVPYKRWSAGLNPQQQSQVLKFVWQTLPTTAVLDQNGQPRTYQTQ